MTNITPFSATIGRKVLCDALEAFKAPRASIIERSEVPILQCVLLEAGHDCLTISGTDLDMCLSVQVPADCQPGAALAVDHATLLKAVKGATCDTVAIADIGGEKAFLSLGGGSLRLDARKAADFPRAMLDWEPETDERLEFSAEELRSDLARVAVAISTEETRYYLNGAFFHMTTDEYGARVLRIAATDGHRLSRITRSGEGQPDFPDAIIPRRAIGWMLRRGLDEGQRYLTITKDRILLRAGSMRLVSKVIDGTFPDYGRVLPSLDASAWQLNANAKDIAQAAKAATAHMDKKGPAVTISMGEGWANAVGVCPENGRAVAEIAGGAGRGEECSFGVNSIYFIQGCGAFGKAAISLRMHDAACPMLLESQDAPEFVHVIMPVRIGGTVYSPEYLAREDAAAIGAMGLNKPPAGATTKSAADDEAMPEPVPAPEPVEDLAPEEEPEAEQPDTESAPVIEPDSQPDELEALRAAVIALTARVEAMEAERAVTPSKADERAQRARDGREWAIRKAWEERARRRAAQAEAGRMRKLWEEAGRRNARLRAVLSGRKAQIAELARSLMGLRNHAADMRAKGQAVPALSPVVEAEKPAATTHRAAQPGRMQMQRRGGRFVMVAA